MEITNQHLTRQLDLIPVEVLNLPINIVGAGAIGSFLSLQLAKMGFLNQTIWDFDEVSVENMSCQFYRHSDIGAPKVFALKNLLGEFINQLPGRDMVFVNEKFSPQPGLAGIVISAVDNMDVRREIYEAVKRECFQVKYIIDPRMGAEDALLYVINPFDPKDQSSYEKTLYSDQDALQERCTAKSTIYTANLLSGLVAKAIKNIACKEIYPRITQWSIKHNEIKSWTSAH